MIAEDASRHRRCVVVRGTSEETHAAALALLSRSAADAALWVGSEQVPFQVARPRAVAAHLGRSYDAAVLDAHQGFDADVLGQLHGMIRGGGVLILRRNTVDVNVDVDVDMDDTRRRLVVHPHTIEDVHRRFDARVERTLVNSPAVQTAAALLVPPAPPTSGTAEQATLARKLTAFWRGATPTRIVLTAARGRGKSSTLGLALRSLLATPHPPRVAVAGVEANAVGEVLRFASDGVEFTSLPSLLTGRFDVIVIDEAAQVPVHLLQRIVEHHPDAHIAFATTTHGYEGTGRGFSLRFVDWLEQRASVEHVELREPIRWSAGDPLERMIFDALLLDCELVHNDHDIEVVTLDRNTLHAATLREFFGLLVHAHYRTTPGDLHRILDAPNLELHAALAGGHIVGATVVAREGDLPPELCASVASGVTRIAGHALADALVAHLGQTHAGELRMRRSVRIAVHPALRRRGIATRLVQHVHAASEPDLFGTMFGATADLIAFRRALGYEVVRLSASRGTRTGEPAVMMLRANSDAARHLVASLRSELARELPLQLELLQADEELLLAPDLITALSKDLPPARSLTDTEALRLATAYAHGPRTFESCATAITHFTRHADLTLLPRAERKVLESRVLARQSWQRSTESAALPTARAAMRTLRQAIRHLLAGRDRIR